MPTRKELIAYGKTDDQVAEAIGADLVIYQVPFKLGNTHHLLEYR